MRSITMHNVSLFVFVAPFLFICYFWIDNPYNGCVGEYAIRS